MSIANNISAIRSRISAAAVRRGRDQASIKLIAVSKTKPVEQIQEAIAAGQLIFGENYAQELRDKAKEILTLSPPSPLKGEGDKVELYNLEWHYIGHLQKNKIKYVVPVASWIHTIDSAELLGEIVKRSALSPSPLPLSHQGRGKVVTPNYLIEVNIAGEANKSGVAPENMFDLVSAFSADAIRNTHCALRGLMCMPPFSDNPETSRPYFKKLKNLLDEINSRSIYLDKLTELSMGMTQDFEVAIEEGATMVRIGSAIFGERQ